MFVNRDVYSPGLICQCAGIFVKGVHLQQAADCLQYRCYGLDCIAWRGTEFSFAHGEVSSHCLPFGIPWQSWNQRSWYLLNLEHQDHVIHPAIACVYCICWIRPTLCRTRIIWKFLVVLYSSLSVCSLYLKQLYESWSIFCKSSLSKCHLDLVLVIATTISVTKRIVKSNDLS